MDIKNLDNTYVAHTYGREDIVIESGKGSLLYDENGKEYIDLGSGIAVNIFGAADEEHMAAVNAQLQKIAHTSNLYYTRPCAELAELLCEKSGMKKVFFGNSGAEANECAIKVARKYSHDKYGDGRNVILTLNNSFHGRTVTTLSATGQDHFHQHFFPFTEGFRYGIDTIDEPDVCAVMLEIVQGEGGVNAVPEETLELIAKKAAEKDILVIVDEVQTGLGRTGSFFAYMDTPLKPDIVTSAKGLGGGLPIGAALFGEKTENVLNPGDHGSTFGGNPAVAAGAVSIIKRIDDALMADVRRKSDIVFSMLENAEGVESVTGKGLMIGIKGVRPAAEMKKELLEKGVIVLTAKDKLRLVPALNIPEELLIKAAEKILEVLK